MKLLYIEASPRKDNSISSRVANAFVEAYKTAHPNHEVEHLPLFDIELPNFSGEGANQKMTQIKDILAGGTGIEVEGEWAGVVQEIERLKRADKVLICQPGLSFYVSEGRYIGMITEKPMLFILASGSPYEVRFPLETDGTETDFQRAYLEHIARFIGFDDINVIKIEPTATLAPDALEIMLISKCEEAGKLAAAF